MRAQYLTDYVDGEFRVYYVEFGDNGQPQVERLVKTTKSRVEAWETAERLNKLPQNREH